MKNTTAPREEKIGKVWFIEFNGKRPFLESVFFLAVFFSYGNGSNLYGFLTANQCGKNEKAKLSILEDAIMSWDPMNHHQHLPVGVPMKPS